MARPIVMTVSMAQAMEDVLGDEHPAVVEAWEAIKNPPVLSTKLDYKDSKIIKMKDKTKEKIRATQLMNLLTDNANGGKMTPAQVQSASIVLKKLVPDLSAVEQKIVNEKDAMSEEAILEQMRMILESDPSIAKKLGYVQANVIEGQVTLVHDKRED